MRDLGREVEYMIAEDEGHGFLNEENRMAMVVAMEKFLSKHLGGRYQKEVNPDIEKQLASLMVDVSAVALEAPAADPEKAMKAPLPTVDVTLLSPMTFSYTATMVISGQEIPLEVTKKYEKSKHNGKPVWLCTSVQSSPMGAGTDTLMLDPKTLVPIMRHASQGPTKVALEFTETSVKGMISTAQGELPIDTDLPAPVFGDDASLEMAIEAMPLGEGYTTTLRIFELISQKARAMALEVTGIETISVPAGNYDAYKLELKPLDGEPGGGTLFVSEKDPRCVIRATYQLPAQLGGGTFTTELTAAK
jgi:hypothetical protein